MSASPYERTPPHSPAGAVPDRTPQAIRAALLPEERGDFDREFRGTMREATETLDLTVVGELLERWWRIAVSSTDPASHRRMLEQARRIEAGADIQTTTWADLKARLGV
jgi:hypothetical protein